MVKNHSWVMFMDGDKLFVSRGGDEIYYMDEIAPEKAKLLLQAYNGDGDGFDVPASLEREAGLLVKAGVLCEHAISPVETPLSVGIKWAGNEDAGLTELLHKVCGPAIRFVPLTRAGFILILRTSEPLFAMMGEYAKISQPHLLVDLGYAHTVSAGPLVFPGKTACLSCFAGRVTAAWGDLPPPERPDVLKSAPFTAGLIAEILAVIAKTGTHPELVYQTVSFNLNTLKSQTDAVFTLPWCPVCYPGGYPGTGKLDWRPSVC